MRRMVRDYHGAESDFTGNVATEYGTYNEAGALIDYRMETGNAVEAVGFITKDDWAGCSPDGLIGLTGGLEIKCPYSLRKMTPEDSFKTIEDQPHYYDQVQFSLWVCERAWWDFFQWAPGGYAKTDRILPDSKWRAKNLPKLKAFYDEYLIEREQPNAQKHLDGKRVEIDTPSVQMMLSEYDDLSEAIEQAQERKKEILAELVKQAGDKNATVCGRNLTKVEKEGAVSYAKAIKALLPNADLEPYRGAPSSHWLLK